MAGNVFKFFVPRLWLKRDLVIRARRYMRAVVYTFNLHTIGLAVLASLAVVSTVCCPTSSNPSRGACTPAKLTLSLPAVHV